MLTALEAKQMAEAGKVEKIDNELKTVLEMIKAEAKNGKFILRFSFELYEENKKKLMDELGYEVETRFYESGDVIGTAEVYTLISWDNAKKEEEKEEEEETVF